MPISGALTPAIELPNRALDVYETAEILGLCVATVRRETNRGRLHGVKAGSRWRYRPEDIANYLDRQTPAEAAERHEWDAYIRRAVAKAGPLTPEQVAALSALFDWEPDQDAPQKPPAPRNRRSGRQTRRETDRGRDDVA